MATFTWGGNMVTFRLLLQQPALERQAMVTVTPIPGGNLYFVDNGGQEPPSFKVQAKLDSYADLILLLNAVGQTGALVYSEDTWPSAELRSCRRTKATGRLASGGGGGDQWVELDFLCLV
jgi:hypothetical protein